MDASWLQRRYGRITGEQLRTVLSTLVETETGIRTLWRDIDLNRWLERFPTIPNWVPLYQHRFVELIAAVLSVSGAMEVLERAPKDENPVDLAMRLADDIPDEAPDDPRALPLAFALVANMEAIASYSRSVNDMLQAVREKQDFLALGQALSVDSTLTTLPFVQALLRYGQISGERSFSREIFSALKGPHKGREVYRRLRWIEYVLRDQGAFESSTCTEEDIHDLIVNRLKLYGDDSEHKDSKKAMFAMFRKWRKEAGN